MDQFNGGSGVNAQNCVEKLVGTNYNYWRMYMEDYLQGHDLWELVAGSDVKIPADTLKMLNHVGNGKSSEGRLYLL